MRRWFGTWPYRKMFGFWKWVLSRRLVAPHLRKKYPYFPELSLYLAGLDGGVPEAVNREAFAKLYLGNLLKRAARRPAWNSTVITFFTAERPKIEGCKPLGPAVMVMSHQCQTLLVTETVFAKNELQIIGYSAKTDPNYKTDSGARKAAMTRDLMAAEKHIKSGGLVGILGDGRKGNQELWLPFCGTRFPFQAGFAAMAIRHCAPTVFATARLGNDGMLVATFGEPVQPIDGERPAQIERYLEWYAGKFEEVYRQYPESITPGKAADFLSHVQTGS